MRHQIIIVLCCLFLTSGTAYSHESSGGRADIALTERLGEFVSPDALFTDENGHRVNLRETLDKPTIIAPIYLNCTHSCPLLLTGLAQVLGRLDTVEPGRDFQVLALSFDDQDTPAVARDKKENYLKAVGRPFPAKAWKFLTGDAANIRKFTDSIGYAFQRDGENGFSHPIALVVIAPSGKIVRYLEGFSFLPFEVTMALNEASAGRTGSPMRKALLYCFSYDPLKKSYVFNILKVTGTAMVLFIASFLVYLFRTTKKHRAE